jgi:hypothetical protein
VRGLRREVFVWRRDWQMLVRPDHLDAGSDGFAVRSIFGLLVSGMFDESQHASER